MACEAITNAIRHSDSGDLEDPGTATVVVSGAGRTVRVEVLDASSPDTAPRLADEDLEAVSGRGLHLLDILSGGRWGSCDGDHGRTVWFEAGA